MAPSPKYESQISTATAVVEDVTVTAAEKQSKTIRGLKEIGDSGTEILQGIVTDEYNTQLRDIQGIQVYDEMRKSDGTVRASMLAVTLPIRRAKWIIVPASEDQIDIDAAEFVEKALFDWMSITWNDFLRQSLLMLAFGVMPFEKVFQMKTYDGKEYITLRKLAPRMPKSISRWSTADGNNGIEQRTQDGNLASIPMEKLVVFVNEKEGENWWGTSMLRSGYKHWYIKNQFYRIDAIAFERQGLGVPYAKLPENASEADRAKAEEILKNLRANHQAFIIEPHDYDIGFKDMMAKTLRDPKESIMHHNREIVKGVLAQFLELGATDSGSRALSTDQTDLFLQGLEATADQICDVMNKYVIEQLTAYNFDVENFPKLTYTGITRGNAETLSKAYDTLIKSGGMRAGENDEEYFRELLGLPDRDMSEDEEIEEPSIDPEPEIDDEGNPVEKVDAHEHIKKKIVFAEDGSFKSFRALTFAEKKVNYKALQTQLDKLEEQLAGQMTAELEAERKKYISALTKAVEKGDVVAAKAASMKMSSAYEKAIKANLKQAYEYGKLGASDEMGIKAIANSKKIIDQIDIHSAAIAEHHAAETTAVAKNKLTEALAKGESNIAALAAADAAIAKKIASLTRDYTQIAVAGYINHGRGTAFESNMENIYALQRSELLDSRTCNYCLSVDGRVVEKNDSFASNSIFHSGCRGIWVEILLVEEELPSIGGIPKSVRDRFDGTVNDLIQPKEPITKQKSAATKEVERRAKRKANKK